MMDFRTAHSEAEQWEVKKTDRRAGVYCRRAVWV